MLISSHVTQNAPLGESPAVLGSVHSLNAGASRQDHTPLPCFCAGTLVDTPMGRRAVETLAPGDWVRTLDGGAQQVLWVGHRMGAASMVVIPKGAFAPGFPNADLRLAPDHRILVRHAALQIYFDTAEALLAAKYLVGWQGITVSNNPVSDGVYVMMSSHHLLRSCGLWCESVQPSEQWLATLDQPQREALFDLAPQLRAPSALAGYHAARMELNRHEARVLLDQKGIRLGLAG